MHRDVSSEAIAILPTFVEPEDGDDHTLRVVWRGILAGWEFARPMPAHGENQPMVQPRIPVRFCEDPPSQLPTFPKY